MSYKPRPISSDDIERMTKLARIVRRESIEMIYTAGSGNPGSTLSPVEMLVWLYDHELRIDRKNQRWSKRDRFILSKGQACPAYYSLFEKLGWITNDEFKKFRNFNTRLATHPEYDSIDAIDFPSGSLGMGLSGANGMALAQRLKGHSDSRFFVMMGDGELQEGQVWEAVMTAGHYNLYEVILLIDRNVFQGDRSTADLMALDPLEDKFLSFGWDVKSLDGHNYEELFNGLNECALDKPKAIIANTIKGKGVSFMEGDNFWHAGGKKFTSEFYQQAMKDLEDPE